MSTIFSSFSWRLVAGVDCPLVYYMPNSNLKGDKLSKNQFATMVPAHIASSVIALLQHMDHILNHRYGLNLSIGQAGLQMKNRIG